MSTPEDMDSYDTETTDKVEELNELLQAQITNIRNRMAARARRTDADKELTAILEKERVDRESRVIVLGKVTVTQDIYGTRIEELKGIITAADSEIAISEQEGEVRVQQMKELEDFLEDRGVPGGRYTRRR